MRPLSSPCAVVFLSSSEVQEARPSAGARAGMAARTSGDTAVDTVADQKGANNDVVGGRNGCGARVLGLGPPGLGGAITGGWTGGGAGIGGVGMTMNGFEHLPFGGSVSGESPREGPSALLERARSALGGAGSSFGKRFFQAGAGCGVAKGGGGGGSSSGNGNGYMDTHR